MDWEEYRFEAKKVVDFIADYMMNIRDYRVFPAVQPGYMRELLPDLAPEKGESWNVIFDDIKKLILPGVTHWQSPYFHAYFPALNSPASLMGDMLADAFNCLGFTWASSPACTELEVIVMDWLAKAIHLPSCFLNEQSGGKGGGVIQTTASEATFVSLLCARTDAIRRIKQHQLQQFQIWEKQQQRIKFNIIQLQNQQNQQNGESEQFENDVDNEFDRELMEFSLEELEQQLVQNTKNAPALEEDSEINSKLVAYCSDQAHSSVEKASLIGLVKLRYIESDENYSMRINHLEKCIIQDTQLNLMPFFICATLGTTGCCSFDNIRAICEVANRHQCYVHVDGAYAGSAFICEEFRYLMDGIELIDSIAFNPSKWLNVHFDCTALWFKRVAPLHRTFNVNPLYLKHEQTGFAIDYMHWQIPLSRRFRALKLWCVLRNFGVEGLQEHIRRGVQLAAYLEDLIMQDDRFEIAAPRILGLVVFRLKSGNELTECLLKKLNSQGKLHCVPASLRGTYVIRFAVTSARTNREDIDRDWLVIQQMAAKVLMEEQQSELVNLPVEATTNQPNAKTKTPKLQKMAANFGTSLLLCNSPMTPKLVNGSFAAIIDENNHEVLKEFVNKFSLGIKWRRRCSSSNTALRQRIKGLMLSDKQYSLDSRIDCMMATVEDASILNRTGSAKEKNKGRKQTRIQQLLPAGDDTKSSKSSIQEEDE